VARNQWIPKGEEEDLKEIEVEAFGRRSRATVVERCAYDWPERRASEQTYAAF